MVGRGGTGRLLTQRMERRELWYLVNIIIMGNRDIKKVKNKINGKSHRKGKAKGSGL